MHFKCSFCVHTLSESASMCMCCISTHPDALPAQICCTLASLFGVILGQCTNCCFLDVFFPAFFSHQGPHLALLSHLCSELINAMSFMLAANKLLLHCLHPAVVLSRVYCHCPYHSSGKEPGAAFTFPTHHTHAHHTHDKADNDNACHVFHWHHSGMVL